MTTSATLARAVLAGAASGGRTFTGIAALAVTAPRTASRQPDATLARPGVRAACCVAAAGELVGDKLPGAPSRLVGAGLAGRMTLAAVCGVVVARRVVPAPIHAVPAAGETVAVVEDPAALTAGSVVVSVAACAGAAVLGVRWRTWAGRGPRSAVLAALAEDAAVIGLAAASGRVL